MLTNVIYLKSGQQKLSINIMSSDILKISLEFHCDLFFYNMSLCRLLFLFFKNRKQKILFWGNLNKGKQKFVFYFLFFGKRFILYMSGYFLTVTETHWQFEPGLAAEGSVRPDWFDIIGNQAFYIQDSIICSIT